MSMPRAGHTATLLGGGQVLVAGGCTKYEDAAAPAACSEITSSSELFDPRSGKWTKTGDMKVARFGHTATLLKSGSVLVVGGCVQGASNELTDCKQPTGSAEIFDPAKKTWSPAGTMRLPRVSHTATLLEGPKCGPNCGRVLVAGGPPIIDIGEISASVEAGRGGAPNPGALDSIVGKLKHAPIEAETYDPKTNKWGGAGTPPGETEGLPAAVPLKDGRVLLTGISTAIYSPAKNKWEAPGRSDPVGRIAPSANLLKDGRVLVVGGSGQKVNAEFFDPNAPVKVDQTTKKGKWQPVGAPRIPRQGHRAVMLKSGETLVIGGASHLPNFLSAFLVLKTRGTAPDSMQVTEPGELFEDGRWSLAGEMVNGRMTGRHHQLEMSTTRPEFTATLLDDGRVLVAGGKAYLGDRPEIPLRSQKQSAVSSAEAYTPEGLVIKTGSAGDSGSSRFLGLKLPGGNLLALLGGGLALLLALTFLVKKAVGRK